MPAGTDKSADSATGLILRVFAPTGRYRVSLPSTASYKQLYSVVAEHCGYVVSNKEYPFALYADPEYRKHLRRSSSLTIGGPSGLLSDGQILYVKLNREQQDSAEHSSESPTERNDGQNTGGCSASTGPLAAASPSTPAQQGEQPQPTAPKFKAFDAFLRERSYNVVDLPLSSNYRPVELVMGRPNTIPSAVTLKHQAYRHVDHVEFMNVQEMNNFVQYWRYELEMVEQRAGWLLGHYFEDPHYPCGVRAVVEGIYEPPQISTDSSVTLLDDAFLPTVKSLASMLGLRVVGWIFTHLPRDELLTSAEVIKVAEYQLAALAEAPTHYTNYPVSPFITVTVAVDASSDGGGGGVITDAFMVSDLGMAFLRDGLLGNPTEPGKICLRTPEKLLPEVLESGKAVTSFDSDWFIVRVNDSAPKKVSSIFKSWSFPVENRKRPIRLSDVTEHLRGHPASSLIPFADLHFILYLAQLFDLDTAATVCSAVQTGVSVDPALVETLRTLHR